VYLKVKKNVLKLSIFNVIIKKQNQDVLKENVVLLEKKEKLLEKLNVILKVLKLVYHFHFQNVNLLKQVLYVKEKNVVNL